MDERGWAVSAIDHVQLAMPAASEREAAAFYEGLLGIPEVAKPEPMAARGGCWFESGELKVHLGVDPDFRPATKAHPALTVSGLRALAASLEAAGVAVRWDDELTGWDRAFIADPFGNRIELMERLA